MSGINSCTFIGRLGQDPEVRHTSGGSAVATISIAVSETWKDKQSGEKKEHTEWIRCTLWNRLGEIAGEYLKKGSLVYIEGKMETKKWQDKEGKDQYTTGINVRTMQMLESRDRNQPAQQGNGRPVQTPPPQQKAPVQDDFDDDVPFANPYQFTYLCV